jgi:hypothetical protein
VNDDDLREAFRSLKRRDASRAPPFDAMWRREPRRSPWRVVVPIVSLAAAAAAVLVVWCGSREMGSTAPLVSHASSQPAIPADLDPAPLDFLLDTRGVSALAGMPDFDVASNLHPRR